MFEFLFNYPSSLWRDASLVFDTQWPLAALLIVCLLAIVLIVFSLLRITLSLPRRLIIAGLQATAFAVLLTMLWQPSLLVQGAEKGENTVAWVLDSSRSMSITDALTSSKSTSDPSSRFEAGARLISTIAVDDEADFEASLYTLGSELVARNSANAVENTELTSRTLLASGLETLLSTVSESALAGVVLISDGSDNSELVDAQWWQSIAAAGVPIHTVGIGNLFDPDDLQLSDVILPLHAAPDALVKARLKIAHGKGGQARVRVFSGDELIAAEDIVLPDELRQSEHIIDIPTGDRGIQQLEFTIEGDAESASAGLSVDPDIRNNRQPRVLRIKDEPRRILYVEGEPRWEYKFLRRALDQQPGVKLVSLLRTSANKFYRQGVSDASELADGFPADREELFNYEAVIIGSLEAAELSTSQQSALRDFVSVRGGSLLMLGGRNGLADGGWGRSVTAAALPVLLDSNLNATTFDRQRSRIAPTLSGFRTPWLKLADADTENVLAWEGLPALADGQSVGSVKPGAVVLLERAAADSASAMLEPLLVTQRYGRGQSLVFGTSGTWRWQMGLPSEDERHERFWRQLAFALVDGVLPRISVQSSAQIYRDANSAVLSVTAYNADFSPLQQAELPVQVTGPDGGVKSVALVADAQHPGVYTQRIETSMDGPYAVMAMTPLGGESPQSSVERAEDWWVQETGSAESFDAWQQRNFLQRVADVTGGNYLPLEDSDQLVQILAKNNSALKRELRLPLWNMPFFFLCLFVLKGVEWLLRLRWKRL